MFRSRAQEVCIILGCAALAAVIGMVTNYYARPETRTADVSTRYPKGAWRFARHQLDDVVLTFSHILVLDEESSGEDTNLRAPGWQPEAKSKRTREQARARAIEIAMEAHREPAKFAELAKRKSDDEVTKARGGSLGTWSAAITPPEFLDAFQGMKPGDVSRVVETPLGFHVLMLRETPPEQNVAARRIVIGYRDTSPMIERAGHARDRTREQALATAIEAAAAARRDPTRFAELVQKLSDHADFIRGGDIGVWSNRRPFVLNREIELISELAIGQVSDPIDGSEGFSIFIRDEATERPLLAVAQLAPQLKQPLSPTAARKLAGDLTLEVSRNPAAFERLQSMHCCAGVEQWRLGRGLPAFDAVVSSLAVGEITGPIEVAADDFRILKRVAPAAEPVEHALTHTLPSPSGPDQAYLAANAKSGRAVADYIIGLHDRLGQGFGVGIDATSETKVRAVIKGLASDLERVDPSQREQVIGRAKASIRQVLGAPTYDRYYANVASEIARDVSQ